MQRLVVHEPRRTELAAEKFRLFRCWVDTYFCGFDHAVNNARLFHEQQPMTASQSSADIPARLGEGLRGFC
ncbi:hypothetical protein SAMN05421831_10551 [Allopseudospirillum japonicum]|uniref:Uncharacterized protein n=1 Tax=Allopseudospirillum japonicum TaxID=64971 RepID=A0A1H6S989_9GAMM|nr:hypothetical protein SAMN05421831_10551 [Allopseudospirillum japonicum]